MFVFPPSPPSSGSGSGSSASLRAAESHATSSPAARQSTGMSSTSTTFAPSSRSSPSGASAGAALLHTMQMQMQAQLQHMQHMQMPMLTTTPPPTSLSFAPSSSSSSSSSSSLSFPHQHQHQHQQHIHQSQSLSPSPSLIPYQLPSSSVSPHQQFSNNINSRNMTVPNDHSHQQQQSRQPLAAAPVVPLPVDLVRTVDPAGLGPSSVMPTATYVGYVEELADALYIFEGTQAGMLPRTTRRLTAAEKDRAVYHGAIHVFLERESGIKRWTDKLHWSASRIAGHFLMYREIEPATPAAKQAAAQAAAAVAPGAAAKVRTPTSSASSGAAAAGPTPPRSPAVTGGGTDANADAASSASDPAEKPACPMARKSGYAIKSTGLIKRTVSLVYRGITHHLVSYFDESRLAELPRPRLDPRLNHLPICSEVKPLLKKAQGSSAGQASSTTTATTVNGGSGGDMPQLAAHAKRAAADDPAEGVSTVNANCAGGAMYALESVVSHKRSRKTRTSPSAATTTAAAALSAIASQVSTPPQSPAQEPPAPQPDAGPPPPAQGQAAPAMVLPTHTSVFAPMPRSASCLSNGPQLVIDHTLHQAQSSTPCNSPPMFDTSLPTSPTSPHWPSTSSLAAPRPSSMIAAAASASATPRSGLSEWAPAAPGMPNEGPPPPTEYQSASSPVVGPGVYHTFMSPPQQLDLWSPAAHSPALSFEDHPPTAAQPAWVFAALPPMIPNEAAAAMGGGGVWGPAYGNANVAAVIAANQFWASTAAAAAAAQGGVYMHGPPPPPPPPPHHHHHMHHAAASVPMLSPNTFAQVLASPDPAADAFVYLPAAHAVPPHLMGMVPLDSLSATGASASAGTPVSASPMMPDASPLLSMQMDGMGIDSPVMHSAEMGGLVFGPGQGQERASAVMDLFATAPPQQQHMQAPAEFAAGGAGGCGSTLSGLFSPVMSPTAASGPTPSEFDVTAWLANGTSGTDEEDNQGKHKDVVGDGPEKQRR